VPPLVSTLTAVGILVRPSWTWLSRLRPLAVHLATLFVLSVAISAGNLMVAVKDTPNLARLVKGINDVTTLVLVVITLITMVQLVVEAVRLVRSESA
jgi:hypothetical protein